MKYKSLENEEREVWHNHSHGGERFTLFIFFSVIFLWLFLISAKIGLIE